MEIYIKDRSYELHFDWKAIKEVAKILGTSKFTEVQEQFSNIGFDNLGKVAQVAIKSGLRKNEEKGPPPTVEQIEQAFSETPGIAGEVMKAYGDSVGLQLGGERANQIDEAAEGK